MPRRPWIVVLLAALTFAGRAEALPFAPASFEIFDLATVDTIGGTTLGLPTGGVQLVGSTAADDVVAVFRVTVHAGAYDAISAFATPPGGYPDLVLAPTGAGVVGGSGLAPDTATIFSSDRVQFRYADDAVAPGVELATFFVSFDALGPGDALYVGVTSIFLPFGRTDLGSTTVPEPPSVLLLVAVVAAARRALGGRG